MKRILILAALLSAQSIFGGIFYPDFMFSMTRKGKDFSKHEDFFIQKQKDNDCHGIQNLEVFRTVYTRSLLALMEGGQSPRIPKIVHQIWLGSPVPVKYTEWMRSWMGWMGWEYKLWTEEDVKALLLYNQDLYDGSTSYGEKTDILRLELLLHFGGIYTDIDFECVNQPLFDELNDSFDFYVGLEPLEHGTVNGTYKVCNAIIGAIPYHPIIKNLVINMKLNWQSHEHESAVEKSGPDYFSRTILNYEKGILFSPEIRANNTQYRNIYLPCTFFYPFSEPDIRRVRSYEELISNISAETAAIHYWSGSWLVPGGR